MPERGSDKHGPRLDEAMHKESEALERGAPVEPRVEELREAEPGSDEPVSEPILARPGSPSEGADDRSELARYVDRDIFPAGRDALIQSARRHHAPPEVEDTFRSLPDRVFETVDAVWRAARGTLGKGPG